MNAYTTIEESKKLLELGLNSETADACYDVGYGQIKAHIECENFTSYFTNDEYPELKDRYIPCWSLAALIELLPDWIEYWDKEGYFHDVFLNIRKHTVTYRYFDRFLDTNIQLFEASDKSLTSCVCKTIIWLLKNNYIKSNKNE